MKSQIIVIKNSFDGARNHLELFLAEGVHFVGMEMDKRDVEFQECTCIHCKATDHTRKGRRVRGELSAPDGMEQSYDLPSR